MKEKLLLILLLTSYSFIAQEYNYVTKEEYAQLKKNNQLTGNEVLLSEGMVDPSELKGVYVDHLEQKAYTCDGYSDPIGGALSVTSQDDGWASLSPFSLPFNFCFFGDSYNQVWMNNNGNISFDGGISSYTSSAFPSSGNEMIAAFWADVDLTGAGTMHATITPTSAIFNWVGVGYYDSNADKLCTFQIIITDGSDPIVQDGNAAIHFPDMQWTTGEASDGINGFGGSPATVGANRGNGTDFIQIGQFDHEGTDYSGPSGISGVSWLDNKSFAFDFCAVGGNISPLPLETSYCEPTQICSVGDTLVRSFPFISPELGQTTSVTYSAPTLNNVQVLSNASGNTGEITLQINGPDQTLGIHDIVITATDNFGTPGVTVITYQVEIFDGSMVFVPVPELNYSPGCAPVTFDVTNGPYDSYLWNSGATTATYTEAFNYNDILSVIVRKQGCGFKLDSLVNVPSAPYFGLGMNLVYCENVGALSLEVADSVNFGSINWGASLPEFDNDYSVDLVAGTYTATGSDITQVCFRDTTFTIAMVSSPTINFSNETACDMQYQVSGTTANAGGVWSSPAGEVSFSPSASTLNPNIIASVAGLYEVIFTDNSCNQSLSAMIDFYPITKVMDDLAFCQTSLQITGTIAPSSGGVWTTNSPYISFSPDANQLNPTVNIAQPGNYQITFTDNACSNFDQLNMIVAFPPVLNDQVICDDGYQISGIVSLNGGSWSVTSGDGDVTFLPNANVKNPYVTVSEQGSYVLTFTDNFCPDPVSATLYFSPEISVILPDTMLCEGENYTIVPVTVGENLQYSWSNGSTSPSINVTEPNDYTLTISNQCYTEADVASINIYNCDFETPNVIVLSSEAGNDKFFVSGVGIKDFSCIIFDRWGNKVYEYDDVNGHWDGKNIAGTIVEDGVYFYTITATNNADTVLEKQGFIQVFH